MLAFSTIAEASDSSGNSRQQHWLHAPTAGPWRERSFWSGSTTGLWRWEKHALEFVHNVPFWMMSIRRNPLAVPNGCNQFVVRCHSPQQTLLFRNESVRYWRQTNRAKYVPRSQTDVLASLSETQDAFTSRTMMK